MKKWVSVVAFVLMVGVLTTSGVKTDSYAWSEGGDPMSAPKRSLAWIEGPDPMPSPKKA